MTDRVAVEVGPQAEEHDGALFGSELLNPEEASRLLARGPGRLVVFMGEQGTGKTSLCIELYERQRHAGASARFAGSWTLLAFEALAHHRRLAGAPLPATHDELDPHGREILHLALSSGDAPLHLLLANLPGEVFRRLADNQISVADVPWLRRADKLVLIVDGARLCDPATRSTALTRVRQLAERLRSSELPHPGGRLALLVSKWDLVQADPAAAAYWEPRQAELLEDLRVLDEQATALHAAANQNGSRDGLAALRAWLLEIDVPAFDLASPTWNAPHFEPLPEPPPAEQPLRWLPEPRPWWAFWRRRR
jgi:Double-GTPase 2